MAGIAIYGHLAGAAAGSCQDLHFNQRLVNRSVSVKAAWYRYHKELLTVTAIAAVRPHNLTVGIHRRILLILAARTKTYHVKVFKVSTQKLRKLLKSI